MKLSKRERTLLIVVGVLALFAAYYFYFLSPFMADLAKIKTETEQKQAEVNQLSMQNQQITVLEKESANLAEKNKDILQKIPMGFSQPELLQFIYQLILEHGEKTEFTFDIPEDLVKIDSVKATLNFNTDYADLKQILASLKTCRFNNRIVTMEATKIDEETEAAPDAQPVNTKYDMKVHIEAEFFNLKGEAAAK